ncbi:MAG: protein kinase family protein [Planctomycetota bacterium]|jgi:serine/threonine protein kinase
MFKKIGHHFYACGRNFPPKLIEFAGNAYISEKVFKHDFFAATALYTIQDKTPKTQKQIPQKIVLKMARTQHFLGLPMQWLGQALCEHEVTTLRRLDHIETVPHVLERYAKTGFIYQYIQGRSLSEQKELPDDFFDRLLELLSHIHQSNIIYLDMNKRGNIIASPEGKPYLIDFQISLHLCERFAISKKLSAYIRNILQRADIYHLFKHKRKLCPHLMRPHEHALSRCSSPWIKIHRGVATPVRKLRRRLLGFLEQKGVLAPRKRDT